MGCRLPFAALAGSWTAGVAMLGAALTGCGATDHPHRAGDGAASQDGGPGGAGAALSPEDLPDVVADPRERALAETAVRVLTERHLDRRPLDDAVSRRAFGAFIERLDDRKLFLLEGHVHALETYADEMDDQLRRGDLVLARKGAGILAAQQQRVATMAAELLSAPLDFSDAEEVETDPAKLTFCASDVELRDRWRRMLELEILREIAKTRDATVWAEPAVWRDEEARVRAALAATLEGRFARLAHPDPLEAAGRFVDAIANAYDAHTRYVSPAGRSQHQTAQTGTIEGVGVTLADERGEVVVRELLAGGAAWSHGEVAVGDVVVAIAQAGQGAVPLVGVPIERAAAMLQGPSGTKVTLTMRAPSGKARDITLVRSVVAIEAAYARAFTVSLPARPERVGYVYLPSFYDQGGSLAEDRVRNATADVRRALVAFNERGVKAMVLDLRGNRGGLILHAQHMAGLFIKRGPIYQTRRADGSIEVASDIHPTVTFSGVVVVLVDRFSASATEVLAGALQDYRRALVVGTGPTWGKGTVQELVDLDRERHGAAAVDGGPLGLLVLTTQQYYRVQGASTQWRGVVPDIVLPDPAAHLVTDERSLANSLPFATVAPLEIEPHPQPWDPAALAIKTRARVAGEPAFAAFDARERILAEQRSDTEVPLAASAWWEEQSRIERALAELDTSLAQKRLDVEIVDDPLADEWAGSGRARWRDELSRDPWVEEAVHLAHDMRP